MTGADLTLASTPAAKVGVVEDEILIADSICSMLRNMQYTVPEPCLDYNGAIAMLTTERPDLVLLDINLAGSEQDGIAVARYIRSHLRLPYIFLTANSDPATLARAKEVTPNAFLVKPFLQEDLYASIEIAMFNFYSAGGGNRVAGTPEYVFIKEGSVQHKVKLSDILYITSNHVYVCVFTTSRKYLVRTSLQQYLEELDPTAFIRIHRSYVVNKEKIGKISSSHLYVGDVALPLSKRLRDTVLAQVQGG